MLWIHTPVTGYRVTCLGCLRNASIVSRLASAYEMVLGANMTEVITVNIARKLNQCLNWLANRYCVLR